MKSILCYGDSNTWGRNPDTRARFDHSTRWPSLVQKLLGVNYSIIEEGLVGRTTSVDDPEWENRNGKTFLPVALESHMWLDMLIIALGANDLKKRFNRSALDIANGIEDLVRLARNFDFCPPNILIICPPPCLDLICKNSDEFEGAPEKSRNLARFYKEIADRNQCGFLDAGDLVTVSSADGLHLDATGHSVLADAVAKYVLGVFTP